MREKMVNSVVDMLAPTCNLDIEMQGGVGLRILKQWAEF